MIAHPISSHEKNKSVFSCQQEQSNEMATEAVTDLCRVAIMSAKTYSKTPKHRITATSLVQSFLTRWLAVRGT